MATTLLAKCPGCKKNVRLPEDWASRTVRCKFCGMVSQARPNSATIARKQASVAAAAAVSVTNGVSFPTAGAPIWSDAPDPAPSTPAAEFDFIETQATASPTASTSNPFDHWDAMLDQ